MGRNDVDLLNLPLNPRASQPAPAEEEPEPGQPQDQESQAPPPLKRVLEHCPQCGIKLSPLDIKTNKCFKCWSILDVEVPTERREGGRFEVHI